MTVCAHSVLVIHNVPQERETYCCLLRSHPEIEYRVLEADSAETGLNLYEQSQPDCILLDDNLLSRGGLQLLERIVADKLSPRAIVMLTGGDNEKLAVQAMKSGAHDNLLKVRVTADALHRAIQRAIEKVTFLCKIEEQRRELEQLAAAAFPEAAKVRFHNFHPAGQRTGPRHMGSTEVMRVPEADDFCPPSGLHVAGTAASQFHSLSNNQEFFYNSFEEFACLMEQVERIAPQDTSVLITGETGTGKTRLAKQIHELSPRRQEPFMVVNCGALCANLIESEMFGHVKGAFTGADRDRTGKFAAVGRGTLLLDDIDALPLQIQAKLLRVVDERLFEPVGSNRVQSMEARLIAVSNRVLGDEVAAGRFRADLLYRLNIVDFNLLPLRERRSMITFLANHFFRDCASRNGRDICGIADEAMNVLEQHSWPGNIRELRNVIERAMALCPGQEIQVEDLPHNLRQTARGSQEGQAPRGLPAREAPAKVQLRAATISAACEEAEIARIREALIRNKNNRQRTACELGVSRMTLYKKLHRYGLFQGPMQEELVS